MYMPNTTTWQEAESNHPVAPLVRELQLASATSGARNTEMRVQPRIPKASESDDQELRSA